MGKTKLTTHLVQGHENIPNGFYLKEASTDNDTIAKILRGEKISDHELSKIIFDGVKKSVLNPIKRQDKKQ